MNLPTSTLLMNSILPPTPNQTNNSSHSPSSLHHHQTTMSRQRETNPHFLPRQQPQDQIQDPRPEDDPNLHFPIHKQRRQGSSLEQPPPSPGRNRPPQPPISIPPKGKTRTITWFIAVFCLLFWIIVIVGGLIILIVYLHYRPRSPKFDVAGATLNAAYLDMGYLLNVDLTLLTNFTNPNKKVRIDFNYIILNLYYTNTLIATTYVGPFSALNSMSTFGPVHMVSSQVSLPMELGLLLTEQIGTNRIRFEIKGQFRTRSDLGGLLRYSYWLYSHCTIVMTAPPSGVLVAKRCRTKR